MCCWAVDEAFLELLESAAMVDCFPYAAHRVFLEGFGTG